MNFTISTVALSLADYLSDVLPNVQMLEDPSQQGTAYPCMFLQQRYATIKLYPNGRWLRTVGLDLTYLEDYNLPDLQQRYQTAAEALDYSMETFPYTDGVTAGDSGFAKVLFRTYDREWRIDLDAMHYRFELRVWVTKPETSTDQFMETLDMDIQVKVEG